MKQYNLNQDKVFAEFQSRIIAKRDSLNPADSPLTKAETDAYMEGWRSAFAFAIDILRDSHAEIERQWHENAVSEDPDGNTRR
ncbi:MAG: hypothetical protein IIT64_09155 [Bacteroidaceae bacterium]|nr:hypothetical protein [Bacteroidaceae bacterium]